MNGSPAFAAVCVLAALAFCAAAVAPGAARAQAEQAPPGGAGDPTLPSAVSPTVEPESTLAELEDELMCPVCGTLLGLADAPQAHRQRAMIRRMIDQGRDKQEIKDAMVAEFGPEVLAMPEPSGFTLSAYLVPIAGIPIAVLILGVALVRWRRHTAAEGEGSEPSAGAQADVQADADRLDADLDRYDL